MRAVAKWLFGGCATATKCHSFFDWEPVAVGVDQFDFTCDNVRAVLDCFDFRVSHAGTVKQQLRNPKFEVTFANVSVASHDE